MTIAELIEYLCDTIGEMAGIINALSLRIQQTGSMSEGEYLEIQEIRKRISAIGIPIEDDRGVDR